MNKKEGIAVAVVLLSSFTGGAFAAPRLFLSTQQFSQQVTFAYSLGSVADATGVIIFDMWNFTVQLSGRDVGSTWITFKMPLFSGGQQFSYLLKRTSLTSNILAGCGFDSSQVSTLNCYMALSEFVMGYSSSTWHVSEPGDYTVLAPFGSLGFDRSLFTAQETWTVTSIIATTK